MFGKPDRWALIQADSLQFLKRLPDKSVDAVITDPPYGIAFKGTAWDSGDLLDGIGFTAWSTAWAAEVKRVLRPGGYLAAFGAARTMHRLVSGIEDAGLEVRDQVLWLYGSGMPKSRKLEFDLSTTLKPAYEPILLARAPLEGTVMHNLERWGTGALDIGATRVRDELAPATPTSAELGRWPANVGLSHDEACQPRSCAEDCALVQLDQASATNSTSQDISRFFYAGKATPAEREAGLDELEKTTASIFEGTGHRPRANVHPTVKPLSVMRWLTRLVAPPGGLVLDPFCGSGSTGCAALLEGRQFMGIEREAEYIRIARARLAHWDGHADGSGTEITRPL
jgi:site-specific DNA-methyltransferase (adenine-specific)